MKRAFLYARSTQEGQNLGLQCQGLEIWWQGKGGMRLHETVKRIKMFSTLVDPPRILLLHCGGNDLGIVHSHIIRIQIVQIMKAIREMMPNTRLVWSQILPRINWRYSNNQWAMEAVRKRINSFAGKHVIQLGGGYIKYPQINLSVICV